MKSKIGVHTNMIQSSTIYSIKEESEELKRSKQIMLHFAYYMSTCIKAIEDCFNKVNAHISYTIRNASMRDRRRAATVLLLIAIIPLFYHIVHGPRQIKHVKHTSKYVYFDLGSKNGTSLRSFFGLPGGKSDENNKHFLNLVKTSDATTKWIVYAVESNTDFNATLKRVKREVELLGHKLYLFNPMSPCINGSSQIDSNKHTNDANFNKNQKIRETSAKVVKTSCANISRLISMYGEHDIIVVNMDLESAEYIILLELLQRGLLKLIDYISVKFHETGPHFTTSEQLFLQAIRNAQINVI